MSKAIPVAIIKDSVTANARPLIARDIGAHHVLDQPRKLSGEILGHTLFLATDSLGEGDGVAVADLGGERFDPHVDGHLDMLLTELLLRIAQMRLGLLGDERASDAHLALDGGNGLAGDEVIDPHGVRCC